MFSDNIHFGKSLKSSRSLNILEFIQIELRLTLETGEGWIVLTHASAYASVLHRSHAARS